jgi:hypothetical protein
MFLSKIDSIILHVSAPEIHKWFSPLIFQNNFSCAVYTIATFHATLLNYPESIVEDSLMYNGHREFFTQEHIGRSVTEYIFPPSLEIIIDEALLHYAM